MSATYGGDAARTRILETIAWSFQALSTSSFYFILFSNRSKTENEVLEAIPRKLYVTSGSLRVEKNDSQLIILGIGRFPSCDPWGQPFSKQYYPHRMALANQRIAGDYVAVLEGIQGDQDYIRILFSPERCHEDWYSFLPQKI